MTTTLLFIFLASLLIALLLAPLESLGWWAGWFESAKTKDKKYKDFHIEHAKQLSTKSTFVLFLDGIARVDNQENIAQVGKFLSALENKLTDTELIYDLFPYSVSGVALTEQRPLSRFWQYVNKAKLDNRINPIGFTVNLRNMLQVATSADRRYGPVYFQGEAQLLLNSLFQRGYDINKPAKVVIIGYSGGAQMAVGAAPYVQQVLGQKVSVISIGGVVSSNYLLLQVKDLDHVLGSLDIVEKIGAWIFPRRWLLAYFSNWQQAKRNKQIRIHNIGPMTHIGKKSYIDEKSIFENQSHFDKTVKTVVDLVNQS